MFAAHPQASAVKLPDRDVKNAGHDAHTLAPVTFEYAPAGHATQSLAMLISGTLEYVPAAQFMQTGRLYLMITIPEPPAPPAALVWVAPPIELPPPPPPVLAFPGYPVVPSENPDL